MQLERHAPGLRVEAYDGLRFTRRIKEEGERKAAAAARRAVSKSRKRTHREAFMKVSAYDLLYLVTFG